jgi:hypothetical protein
MTYRYTILLIWLQPLVPPTEVHTLKRTREISCVRTIGWRPDLNWTVPAGWLTYSEQSPFQSDLTAFR